jgi:hypothetical protein
LTSTPCHSFTSPTIVDQLKAKGISWEALNPRSFLSSCFPVDGSV